MLRSWLRFIRFLFIKLRSGFRGLYKGEISNYDFGHAEILMEFARVDQRKRLKGRYQHGWYAFPERDFWINDYLPTYVWSSDMVHKANSRNFKNFQAVGSSWLYFLELLSRRGLLQLGNLKGGKIEEIWVFGSHSTKTHDAMMERLINFVLQAQASKASSKILLLYELDYQRVGEYIDLSQIKIPIMSLGPRSSSFYSKAHFFNLYHILVSAGLVVTNYPTSLVCYSLSLNKDIRWFKDEDFRDALHCVGLFGSSNLRDMMELDYVTAGDYKNFAMSELGFDSMRTPEELRDLFKWNSGLCNTLRVSWSLSINMLSIAVKALMNPWGVVYGSRRQKL